MQLKKSSIIIGAVAGILACITQVAVEIYAASLNQDYSPIAQTISILGNPESPAYRLMLIWSIFFSVLMLFFAFAFLKSFKASFNFAKFATVLLVVYTLCEGVGAGIFTMDASVTNQSWTHSIHDLFSGLGDVALILFQIVMLFYFKGKERYFSLLVTSSGIVAVIFFLLAKFELVAALIPFKGLFQRLFQNIYFVFLIVLGFKMIFTPELLQHKKSIIH